MINLLPQIERDALLLKRIKNLVIIIGSVVVVSLICLILILLSIKYYLLGEAGYQKFLLQNVQNSYQSADINNMKDVIQKYNQYLPAILSFYQNEIYFSDILSLISQIQRPIGMRFTDISIDGQTDANQIKVSISGICNNKQDLVAFQKNLQGQSVIKNISFSADSWINPANTFNVTFNYGN